MADNLYNVYEFTTNINVEGIVPLPNINRTIVLGCSVLLKSSNVEDKIRNYTATVNFTGNATGDQNAQLIHFPVIVGKTPGVARTFNVNFANNKKIDPVLVSSVGNEFKYEFFYYDFGGVAANTYTLHVQTVEEPLTSNIILPNVAPGGLVMVSVVKREDIPNANLYDVFSVYTPE